MILVVDRLWQKDNNDDDRGDDNGGDGSKTSELKFAALCICQLTVAMLIMM